MEYNNPTALVITVMQLPVFTGKAHQLQTPPFIDMHGTVHPAHMPPTFTPEETAVIGQIREFRAMFLPLFGERWNDALWYTSVG
jgi:hypothetical protein